MGFSQDCDCPAASTCSTCSGGISSLTLVYKGASTALITAKDISTTVFSQTLNPGDQFTVVGPPPNGKFNGSSVTLLIDNVFNVSIDANCTLIFDPNAMYGSFGLLSAKSLTGGELCCTSNSGDTDPPVITGCPGPINPPPSLTECLVVVTWTEPIAADCALKSFVSSIPPGSPFPIGETTVVYTATDMNNNQTTCSFKVTISDSPPRVSNCPASIPVVTATAGCSAPVTWEPPLFADNCGVSVVRSHLPGAPFPVGKTEVSYIGTDTGGNILECKFDVVVTEKIAPTFSNCPENIPLTVTNSSGQTTVEWTPPTATDNCSTPVITSTHEPGDVFPEGETEVVYTATDSEGNVATCIFTVTVTVEKLELDIGGVVTPDGNGVNDEWVIGNIENYEKNKVVIVDRWGGVVYSAAGYNNASNVWDGRSTHGNRLPTGTYFFTISVLMGNSTVEKKGFIELIR